MNDISLTFKLTLSLTVNILKIIIKKCGLLKTYFYQIQEGEVTSISMNKWLRNSSIMEGSS